MDWKMGRIVCWLSLDVPAVIRRSRIDAPATASAVVDLDQRIAQGVENSGGCLAQSFQVESSALAFFVTAGQALQAAVAIQRELVAQSWPARIVLFLGSKKILKG